MQKKLAAQGEPHNASVATDGVSVSRTSIDQGNGSDGGSDAKLPATGGKGDDSNPTPLRPLVGRLTDERIRRLEEIGFVWSLRDDWQKVRDVSFARVSGAAGQVSLTGWSNAIQCPLSQHYEELKVFQKQTGHCNVPARYAANRRLGIWYVKLGIQPQFGSCVSFALQLTPVCCD